MEEYNILKIKEILQEKEEENLSQERKKGVEKEIFFAYSNMLRELLPIYQKEVIHELWKKYRVQVKIGDELRSVPLMFSSVSHICGFEKILDVIEVGGFIVTYHYGNYRVALGSVLKTFQKYNVNKKINIIIDRDSLEKEPENLKNMKESVNYICAESQSIALEISKKLDNGEWIFIFLDGNTGYGHDRKPISLNFISSNINLRSGIFRLMQIKKKPVFSMLEIREIENPVFKIEDTKNKSYNYSYIELAVNCYAPFLTLLAENPQSWRFWHRHHKQVNMWKEINSKKKIELSEYKWKSKEKTYGINLYDGCIYRL